MGLSLCSGRPYQSAMTRYSQPKGRHQHRCLSCATTSTGAFHMPSSPMPVTGTGAFHTSTAQATTAISLDLPCLHNYHKSPKISVTCRHFHATQHLEVIFYHLILCPPGLMSSWTHDIQGLCSLEPISSWARCPLGPMSFWDHVLLDPCPPGPMSSRVHVLLVPMSSWAHVLLSTCPLGLMSS